MSTQARADGAAAAGEGPAAGGLVMAVPKGRILKELRPLLSRAGIEPEPAFDDPESRQLYFATNHPGLAIVRVRAFDVATFVAFGGAQLGVAGLDVVLEADDSEIYAPLDLGIGACRMSVAAPRHLLAGERPREWSHVRVATKYPHVAKQHFARQGIQAECVKLNGAMELAPQLGLCRRIVDLVSTGRTLRENGLVETETVASVTARLIVNRTAFKTRTRSLQDWLARFEEATDAALADREPA